MKLILTREVAGLGLAGDIVEVADGYGRNFLVPRGAAISWTKGAEKQIAQIRAPATPARSATSATPARSRPTSRSCRSSLGARAGKDGRLFGSITAADIAAAVKDAGGPILDRKRIQIDGHIKTTGSHTVTVDLHPDVVASRAGHRRGGLTHRTALTDHGPAPLESHGLPARSPARGHGPRRARRVRAVAETARAQTREFSFVHRLCHRGRPRCVGPEPVSSVIIHSAVHRTSTGAAAIPTTMSTRPSTASIWPVPPGGPSVARRTPRTTARTRNCRTTRY